MQIPERLKERLQKLGLDESIYSIRSRKCVLSRELLNLERVPWYKDAYYIPDDFDNKKNHFVFDPVSIVPCLALNPKKTDRILDMCAAPGTKTFIVSFLTDNEVPIVANDIDRLRVKRLRYNVNKFSLSAEVRNLSGRKIQGKFDKILLDAPCSGEGMVNKPKKVFEHWSEKRVRLLAKKQKKLAEHAFNLLNEGGTLVYSTCTFEPEENEAVVDHLLNKFDNVSVENVKIDNIRYGNGVSTWNSKEFGKEVEKCIRIYPGHNSTGGFFVAKISKN